MTLSPVIAVVDYGMGNRRSVVKALQHAGADARITAEPAELRAADGLVVPGVGAFPQGMGNLITRGLDACIRDAAAAGTPVLGICLGMQLLFDRSTEHQPTAGLGLIAGEVTPLLTGGLRVPHIGWNDVSLRRPSPLTAGLASDGRPFYHVHSFAARPADPQDVVGETTYGETFATIVSRANVHGVQFHPEKSSADGLTLLAGFIGLCAGDRPATAGPTPVGARS